MFLFFNRNAFYLDLLTFLPRLVTVFFATGVAWILWNLLSPLGLAAVIAGLSLWAFEPSFLAYSGYALADVPAAFFFLLSTLFFVSSKRSPGVFTETLSCLFLGLAVLAKFYYLMPLYPFLFLWGTVGFHRLWMRHGTYRRYAWLYSGEGILIFTDYAGSLGTSATFPLPNPEWFMP